MGFDLLCWKLPSPKWAFMSIAERDTFFYTVYAAWLTTILKTKWNVEFKAFKVL